MSAGILGLVTGIFFGFLLQKGRVLRFEKQVGAMLLKDMTILKFMLSAIAVGMVGVHVLADFGLAELRVKPTIVGANLIGGLLFGIGWAVVGYCPGTAVGAVGEGRWHALAAILGMLCGAALFAASYPFLQDTVLTWGDFGKVTVGSMLGTNHWLAIPILVFMFLGLFRFFEAKRL